ncbi:MAG: hypothetical protein Q9187_006630 [Circinaria calcarea]
MEDDIYRSSTQFRLWSFTEDSLASLRATTNSLAAARVKDAIQRLHAKDGMEYDMEGDGISNSINQRDVDCLTVEEELKLVSFYCSKAMEFAKFIAFPTNVMATAVQYLKRFYLSNSPMTYHPKQMMPSALFLATKTENHYTSLNSFASKLPKTTTEDVLAPEFLLTQGLRFTFDVRHPQRGLEGGFMELSALATGNYSSVPGASAAYNALQQQMTSTTLQQYMLQLEPAIKGKPKARSTHDLQARIQTAHGKAKEILKTSALLTDAYFLYTPSQIWLAALLLVDEPLALFYLDTKLPGSDSIKPKLTVTLQACAELLRSSEWANLGEAEMKELTKIDKKLYECRNPEKMDLIGINKAQKRDGQVNGDAGLDEKIIKKRKLERESRSKEEDSVFGPSLGN